MTKLNFCEFFFFQKFISILKKMNFLEFKNLFLEKKVKCTRNVDSYHTNVNLTRKVDRTINDIVVNVQRSNSFLYHEGFKLSVTIASGEISVLQSAHSVRGVGLIVRQRNLRALNDPFVYNLIRKDLTDYYDVSNLSVMNSCQQEFEQHCPDSVLVFTEVY